MPETRGWWWVALLSLALGGSGCFWLEPIEAFPGDPDSGVDAGTDGGDAGEDAGTDGGDGGDGGDPCGPSSAVPAGAQLLPFEPASVTHFLDETEPLSVTLKLNGSYPTPIWVGLDSTAETVATPEVSGVCIPAGTTSMSLPIHTGSVTGEALIDAWLEPGTPITLTVKVRGPDPVLTQLLPSRAFVAAGGSVTLKAVLSGAAQEDEEVVFTVSGVDPIPNLPILLGQSEGMVSVPVPTSFAPTSQGEVTATRVGGPESATSTLRLGHVVISEILWNSEGFVELYNPTSSAIDIGGWKVDARSDGGGGDQTLATVSSNTSIAAGGYFLISPGPGGDATVTGLPTSAYSWSKFRVRLRNASDNHVDRLDFGESGEHAPPTSKSLERKAWGDAQAADMIGGGAYATMGNGWDTDSAMGDLLERDTPEPQSSQSTPELIE